MPENRESILIVEHDPEISSFLADQALKPFGFKTTVEADSSAAIQRIMTDPPEVLLVDIGLPGLSGKDILVALNAQSIQVPVIMLAGRGMENKVLPAFRLGAVDALFWPVREAEVISAVERALNQKRVEREREQLALRLRQTNQELQQRVQELTTLYNIGKAAVTVSDQKVLFDRLVQGAVEVTGADAGWFLHRDDYSRAFLLKAQLNLPHNLVDNLDRPWDDGLSSMVAISGEPLAIHGAPLKRFKIAPLGNSALVVPVKVKREVIGILEVIRKSDQAFSIANQKLLEAIADYASISIVNARLFHYLEERAHILQHSMNQAEISAKIQAALLQETASLLMQSRQYAAEHIRQLLKQQGRLNLEQVERLRSTQQSLKQIGSLLERLPPPPKSLKEREVFNLVETIRNSVDRYQPLAQESKIVVEIRLPGEPVLVRANPSHILAVLDGLISNAIKFSLHGGQIQVNLANEPHHTAHIQIQDAGLGISTDDQALVFSGKYQSEALAAEQFGGAAIGLPLIREVIELNGGKIWFDSTLGSGTIFHITLPIAS